MLRGEFRLLLLVVLEHTAIADCNGELAHCAGRFRGVYKLQRGTGLAPAWEGSRCTMQLQDGPASQNRASTEDGARPVKLKAREPDVLALAGLTMRPVQILAEIGEDDGPT